MNISEWTHKIRFVIFRLLNLGQETVNIEIDEATILLIHGNEEASPEEHGLHHLVNRSILFTFEQVRQLLRCNYVAF